MKFKEKKKRKKRSWEWFFDIFDVFEILGQILIWLIRGIIHLIVKVFD